MSALVFTSRGEPEQRLDLSPLTPDRLAGLGEGEIERIELQTTRIKTTVADNFRITGEDASKLRFIGGSGRFDRLGAMLNGGEIAVEGDVGSQAGRQMSGGLLTISGSAGPWLASGMSGGRITVEGNAGDWLAGPLEGELAGMRGGTVHVIGNAGEEAGHRLRRGTIVIGGRAGNYAGRAMIAGTLAILGKTGDLPGYLMKRGTILLGKPPASLSPTFFDCGRCDLVFARVLERFLAAEGIATGSLLKRPLLRLAGDAATLGKGEMLVAGA